MAASAGAARPLAGLWSGTGVGSGYGLGGELGAAALACWVLMLLVVMNSGSRSESPNLSHTSDLVLLPLREPKCSMGEVEKWMHRGG